MLDVLLYFNWTYVSVVYSEGCYGESAVDQLRLAAFDNGVCVGVTLALPQHAGVSRAVDDAISRLIDIDARVVILFTYLEETRTLFGAVQRRQLVGRCESRAIFNATAGSSYEQGLSNSGLSNVA